MTKIECVEEVHIHTDGGSRGNPGPAGVGAVLKDKKGKQLAEVAKYIGIATNNAAEYLAVIYALQEAQYLKAEKIVLYLDSQLVARQLTGEYRVKDQDIKKFFDLTINCLRFFKKVDIKEIPREENSEADKLVNQALDLHALI
ncbi:MAG: ribonuclease HI family protein [Candidatus Omnitrophica bacterium]|nr:ribonuclease HI family protein [Candidatus Omnitrophota bacterium]